MVPKANVLAAKYAINDHLHGRFPVYTSHSKRSVVTYSHLSQIWAEGNTLDVRGIPQKYPGNNVHHFQEDRWEVISQCTLLREGKRDGTNHKSPMHTQSLSLFVKRVSDNQRNKGVTCWEGRSCAEAEPNAGALGRSIKKASGVGLRCTVNPELLYSSPWKLKPQAFVWKRSRRRNLSNMTYQMSIPSSLHQKADQSKEISGAASIAIK
jgi:hypothetical protein